MTRPLRLIVAIAILVAYPIVGGCKKGSEAAAAEKGAPTCATCVIADERGFTPSKLELKAGKKGETKEIIFTRTSDDTCARDVVFPELNIKKPLPLNTPVAVAVPVDSAKTLTFQCGMAMYKSSLVIN